MGIIRFPIGLIFGVIGLTLAGSGIYLMVDPDGAHAYPIIFFGFRLVEDLFWPCFALGALGAFWIGVQDFRIYGFTDALFFSLSGLYAGLSYAFYKAPWGTMNFLRSILESSTTPLSLGTAISIAGLPLIYAAIQFFFNPHYPGRPPTSE